MKRILLVAVCVVVVAGFVMAGGQSENKAKTKEWVLTYNQLEKPDTPQGVTEATFAKKIEALSGGQIKIKTYYSGTLFTQKGEVSAIMNGNLDISTMAFQDMAPYLPAAAMFAAPYIFTSYNQMEKVFAPGSKIAADFYQRVSAACGYTPLAAMTQGKRVIDTKWTKPIKTPADMKGMILRMPNSPAWINAGRSLGAKVTPIAYSETYTALQTGVVEAQDNPLPGDYAMKFYEVTKQLVMTNHIIDVKLLCVTNKVWNQMTAQQQKWMKEAAQEACEAGNKTTFAQEAKLLGFMKNYGMIITYPDIKAFQKYSFNYYKEHGLTKDWDMKLYNEIQAIH